jgi:hypothetical protein
VSESDQEEELAFVGKETPSKDTEKAGGDDDTGNVETVKDAYIENSSPVDEFVNCSSDELAHTAAEEVIETTQTNAEGQETAQGVSTIQNEETVEAAFVESVETPTVADTQETLTLVASQFGEEELADEPKDEATKDNVATEEAAEEESQEYTQFSQGESNFTQTERFSQSNLDVSESNFQVEEQSQDGTMPQNLQLGQETQAEASQEY